MDAAERALLQTTIRDAIANADGEAAVDSVLADLGWLEMLDAEPRDAVDIVFTALGETNSIATALDDVVMAALGPVSPPLCTYASMPLGKSIQRP